MLRCNSSARFARRLSLFNYTLDLHMGVSEYDSGC